MTYLDVVVVKEENYSNVVFEGDHVGLWKGFRTWHICLGSVESTENVLGEPNLVQLQKFSTWGKQERRRSTTNFEICLEQEVGDVIEPPFSGLFNRCSI